MLEVLKRNTTLLAGMALSGWLCVQIKPFLLSARGSWGPTILHAQSPLAALGGVLLFLALATAVAVAVGRIINTAVGLFVLGSGLFVLSLRLETAGEVAMSGSSPHLLALETLILAVLVLAAVLVTFRFAGPLRDIHPQEPDEKPPRLWSAGGLVSAAMGVVVLPVTWFLARSEMSGQTIGAVFVGGVLAGLLGRLFRPHVQPALLFASPVFFGSLGHLFAAMQAGEGFQKAYIVSALSPLALPMPVHYAAGTLMGVSFGLGWARSFLHHDEEDERRQPAPAAGGS